MNRDPGHKTEAQWIDWTLAQPRRIAVVGLSDKPHRDSYQASLYLHQQGCEIVPVNPNYTAVMGLPCYARLEDVPGKIEVVNLFQRPERVPQSVASAIAIGARLIWMQLDVVHLEAADHARAAGIGVVMNRCIKIEHSRRFEPREAT